MTTPTTAYLPAAPAATHAAALAGRMSSAVDGARMADVALNMGRSASDAADLIGSLKHGGEGATEFLTMLAHLLKQGVVGSEILEVRGERYTSFADTRIAAPREIAHARRFMEPIGATRLNLSA